MSGINANIYPLQPEIATTLAYIAENGTLLGEIATLQQQTESEIIITNSTLAPANVSLNEILTDLYEGNGAFALQQAGRLDIYENPVPFIAVATPTAIATLNYTRLGMYMLSFNFYISTNTANGSPTPLTGLTLYFSTNGVISGEIPAQVYYPNSAISSKKDYDISVSGVVPFYVRADPTELVVLVSVAPENAGYATQCNVVFCQSTYISPYFPV
jgi:hypothetical protein